MCSVDGLTVDLCGPFSLRHSDSFVLTCSGIDGRVGAAQAGVPVARRNCAFGDSAYSYGQNIRSRTGIPSDKPMNSARECIEWHYGEADQLYPFMCNKMNLRLGAGVPLKELYFIRELFRNCYVCLYGNKTSERFQVNPPSLEQYLA